MIELLLSGHLAPHRNLRTQAVLTLDTPPANQMHEMLQDNSETIITDFKREMVMHYQLYKLNNAQFEWNLKYISIQFLHL